MDERHISKPTVEERQKQIGLWATGIFTALSTVLAGISIFAVVVIQHGQFQTEDTVVMPVAIAIAVASLISYFLIRRGRYQAGSELLLILMMILPVVVTLMIDNFQWIVATYFIFFAPIMFLWVLPRTARWRAGAIIALAVLAVIGIEIWNPAFRGTSDFGARVVPFTIILTVVVTVAYVLRLTWNNIAKSITYRLTLIVIALTIPVLILITGYLNIRARIEIETQAKTSLLENNQTISTNLAMWLELHTRTLKELTIFPDIISMNATRQRPVLQTIAIAHPNLYLVHTTNLNGFNVARNDDAALNDYHDRQWFLGAKSGEVTSEALIGRTTGTPALSLAAPIVNGRGEIIGVASIVSELDEISGEVVNMENAYGISYIVDSGGRVVAHPDPTYTENELKDLSAYPPVAAALNGQTGFLTFEDESGVIWVAYVDRLGNGWGVITQQTETALLEPLRRFQAAATVLILLGSSIMFILVWFTIRRSLRPIGMLTSTVSAIASGDLNRTAEVTSQDEIGVLASTFNEMTARLRESFATLENRVAERTRNLELAAEVGRAVSQVRALDVLLKEAAETIRSQFELYYTQVYLTNPAQDELVLQAGTGTVGAELVGRGHHLPIDTGSINGRAATEKHSVVISDTTSSPTFRQNPLLPDTRSEMAVPLLVGDKVVGVLDMQSAQAGALSEESLPAFEALAGQLAIAIQNASLLAEAERARAEVETQARRLTRANWEDYLDAIHMPEQTGYIYEGDEVVPLAEAETPQPPEGGNAISAPITVTGEPLGALTVELEAAQQSPQNIELVSIVARQVAQQIENLRLLESAERYRTEAEQASRRLTRQGWKSFMEARTGQGNIGYLYDLKKVKQISQGSDEPQGDSFTTVSLKIRDESVGQLAIQGIQADDKESLALANAVAERLGAHIESLRQHDQTQSALAQSEKLFEASRVLTQAADLQELTASTIQMLDIPEINRGILATFNYDTEGKVESLDVLANWWNGTGQEATPIGTHYPLEMIQVMTMFINPTPTFFSDTFTDARVDPTTMELVKQLNLRAVAVLPLHVGTHQVGALILEAEEPHTFTDEETRLFAALAPQIATMLENRRQFERAQKQADRESTLNIISQKIQSATSVEAVLQIAARELGHALGAPMTIAQLSMKDKK